MSRNRLENPGRDDYFTCPNCLSDHHASAHRITICDNCGRKLRCTVEQQDVAVCELVDAPQDDED